MDPFSEDVMEVTLPVNMAWIWAVIDREGWRVAGERWRVELACYQQVMALVEECSREKRKASRKLIAKAIQFECRRSLVSAEGAQRPKEVIEQRKRHADLRVDGIAYLLSKLTL